MDSGRETPDLAPADSTSAAPALFRRCPVLADRIAWRGLGSFPTPVQPLTALSGAGREVWIKRDDLCGSRYGGNKVRKLEFLLGDAHARSARRLVTAGAAGSHHALATTVYGRSLGFGVSLVLFPQSRTEHVRRVVLQDHLLGAELRWVPRMEAVPLGLLAARWAHRREGVYPIQPGGSDPTGTLGFVSAAIELVEQIGSGAAPRPDVVHVAAGTMGTMAGLAIGFALAGFAVRLVGTRITPSLVTNERGLQTLVRRTLRVLRDAGVDVPAAEAVLKHVRLDHEHFGPGYGRATPASELAAARLADAGIATDPTYTAKAAAELIADGEPGIHLFWHTLSATEPMEAIPPETELELPSRFRDYLRGGSR